MSDQHNKSVMGCAGDRVIRTPNLDALAESGVHFTNTYAPAPLCVPSRMSFMTSRLPSSNRVWSETPLTSGTPTLAHVMTLAGYETYLIGRMHFVGPDQRHGFQYRPIGEYTARYPGTRPKGGQPWKHYPSAAAGQFRPGIEAAGYGTTFYQKFDAQVSESACQFLHQKKGGGGKPFFAVVGLVLPHCPYIAPKSLFDYYEERVEIPKVSRPLPPAVEAFRAARGLSDPPVSEKTIRSARAAYYGLTELLDQNVGRILDTLHASQLADETLVLYVSDHGDMIGEHDCWWKSIYYEGSVGVPMIAAGAGIEGPARTCGQLSSLIDVGPTLFDLVCARHIHRHDGISLAACLKNMTPLIDPDRRLISEMVDLRRAVPPIASRMLRFRNWKIWQTFDNDGFSRPVVFDLAEDPHEHSDLGASIPESSLLGALQSDWQPSADRASAAAMRDDLVDVIQRYGRLIDPESADVLPFPDHSIESDVVLVTDAFAAAR